MTLADLRRAIRDLTLALKQADPRIAYVYVRPAPESESRYTPGSKETR
jgi:hypothetical protein